MSRMTWKKNPRPKGLAGVGCGPQGSTLRIGGKELARTKPIGGGLWRGEVTGWYWYGDSVNTCTEPVKTEEEAKAQAVAYFKNKLGAENARLKNQLAKKGAKA